MKTLSYILAVYFLGLSFVTCADGLVYADSVNGLHVVASADSHSGHDHNSNTNDLCSPVCSCQCCHVHVTFPNVIQAAAPALAITAIPSYKKNFSSIDLFDLFVPPKA
ncbi:DUF6660 family protein [Owenweeksia hongkongensis]|uniref:DUF6660 family protein n=1 Tax=Owenweeksia hongkongensis TaxID=253245 RepID=UPI003A94D0F5